MESLCEAAIRRPAIADDNAREVTAQQDLGFGIAAALLNGIDRRLRGRDGPEPLQAAGDFPAGFVRRHDGAASNLLAQGGIGRPRLSRRAMHGVHQPAGRDSQAVLLTQERRDFAEREAQLFVEDHRERDGLRPELDAGSTQRIRRLQRMPALHAPATSPALAHVHAKRADHDSRDGQFFLELRRDTRLADGARTLRTARGQRGVVRFIHSPWPLSVGLDAIVPAGFSAGATRVAGQRLRKRGGLSVRGATGLLQLPLQAIVVSPQPIALPFDAFEFAAQAILFALRTLGAFT